MEPDGQKVRIIVTDMGSGILPEFLLCGQSRTWPGIRLHRGAGARPLRGRNPPVMTRGARTPAALAIAAFEILLIEDNPGDVGLVEECLHELGLPVRLHVASDGLEAMRFLREAELEDRSSRLDLVLLDLHLPGMGGFELLAWLRSEPGLAALEVVMLTCSDLEPDRSRGHELGASGYVVKASDLSELPRVVHAIRAHLSKRRGAGPA